MDKMSTILKAWFPFAITVSLICVILYGVVQQNYRQNADDPQYQMATDAVAALQRQENPMTLVNPVVDLSVGLSPYLIFYDAQGKPIVSGAQLNGKAPELPAGVLDVAGKNGEHALSWQPQPDIRQALVIKKVTGNDVAFVVAGRSLWKVEARIGLLIRQLVTGWLLALLLLFITIWLQQAFFNHK
jgi:hypothetical protein